MNEPYEATAVTQQRHPLVPLCDVSPLHRVQSFIKSRASNFTKLAEGPNHPCSLSGTKPHSLASEIFGN